MTEFLLLPLASTFPFQKLLKHLHNSKKLKGNLRKDEEQGWKESDAKALEEKNQRDLQSQREQEERNRIGGTLDAEDNTRLRDEDWPWGVSGGGNVRQQVEKGGRGCDVGPFTSVLVPRSDFSETWTYCILVGFVNFQTLHMRDRPKVIVSGCHSN
ncbi:hypothetical protein Tco_1539366 [Tanacetum coccineum]